MKRVLIIMVIVSLALSFSACTGGKTQTPDETTPFLGGTNGLIVSFTDGAPPPEAYDGGTYPFDIDVKLKNEGEARIAKEDVRVRISGINPVDFSKTVQSLTINPVAEDLEPRKKDADGNIIDGSEVHAEFKDLNYYTNLSGNTPFSLVAEVCYKYQTIANAKLCIKEDLTNVANSDVCIVNEKKTSYNSAAPVQVEGFSESAVGVDRVSFTFDVVHKGNGNIYKRSTMCSPERSNERIVWVEVNSGEPSLRCSGLEGGTDSSGYINLYNGIRTVRCTQDANSQVDYEKPVVMTLVYDYEDEITTSILMKHLG